MIRDITELLQFLFGTRNRSIASGIGIIILVFFMQPILKFVLYLTVIGIGFRMLFPRKSKKKEKD